MDCDGWPAADWFSSGTRHFWLVQQEHHIYFAFKPQLFSIIQIDQLRSLWDRNGDPLVDNFRPTQPLNNRTVEYIEQWPWYQADRSLFNLGQINFTQEKPYHYLSKKSTAHPLFRHLSCCIVELFSHCGVANLSPVRKVTIRRPQGRCTLRQYSLWLSNHNVVAKFKFVLKLNPCSPVVVPRLYKSFLSVVFSSLKCQSLCAAGGG